MGHHCGRWQGVLVRYDGAGQVLDILDSVRKGASFLLTIGKLSPIPSTSGVG
jgi:hypothetical protein